MSETRARKRLRRRSRALVVWVLVGFGLCQLVLAVPVDTLLPQVRDPEYVGKLERLRARIAEGPHRPLLLMLGSSRTVFGLDAASLSRPTPEGHPLVFNFGLGGSGPFLQLVVSQRLREEGIRPDLVFLELNPTMLSDRNGRRLLEERLLDGARLQVGEVRQLAGYFRQPWWLYGSWMLGRVLPTYRHQAELREALHLDVPTGAVPVRGCADDTYGWCARNDIPDEEAMNSGAQLGLSQYRDYCAADGMAEWPGRVFEMLVESYRRDGIPVVVVLMPEGNAFRALYSQAQKDGLTRVRERCQSAWDVPVIDARTWVEDDGFWDQHHLLARGARRFSERFAIEGVGLALKTLAQRSPADRRTDLPVREEKRHLP